MKNIRAGVIGVGYLGRFHAQKYAAMDGVELVGVADIDPRQGQRVAEECRCTYYDDHQALLQEVDAVSIVVPTSLHHRIASDCIVAGVDILLEKPMTVTLAEADDLIARCAEKNLVLQVGHLERFNPAIVALEPYLSLPVFIESNRLSTFKNRGVDVDVVLDLMIHDIDIILNIIQSPLQSIHTAGAPVVTATTDIANARLIFENGATANVTASRISRTNVRKMRIFQPGSYINVDFAQRKFMTITLTDELLESGMPRQDIHVHSFAAGDALRSEIEHFIGHVRNRTRPLVSGHEGRRALEVALQVMAQIREHKDLEVFRKVSEVFGKQ
ncbi:Gfo/Idh/MocA family oxidoreductase [Desulfoprunum benzoelyticum]|uniref:Putative dehydrogenase n=1 Tax=Desulfoprunum benzoelyticum TaxID=1506996 RepID=A0A840UYB0_9BACT|nr:Gfo/Idh/MocA family oxidoreductase [Desulfoprunum benzoelyticum]MBB5346480.1 putative dehydrogenase [Desulfoprunum benzoelyticum]MBM9528991.1 Gfo/Idh/MocA family oxidoreductase [Desulfoprunum benzoelyticum]